MSAEPCARCGNLGEDRRTLWMACFYAMGELGLPFEEVRLTGHLGAKTGEVPGMFGSVSTFAEPAPGEEPRARNFYTMRVCKECRGAWMGAIRDWFRRVERRESLGSGIFVRENGATVEVSEEEWARRCPGREPVRVRGGES